MRSRALIATFAGIHTIELVFEHSEDLLWLDQDHVVSMVRAYGRKANPTALLGHPTPATRVV
jgi:hypothetical protein